MPPDRVGLVPFVVDDGPLKVVLIQSKDGARWLVPKGRLDKGRGKREMARIEAWEEAGVVATDRLGSPVEVPWRQGGRVLTLRLYPGKVDRLARRYPERGARSRRVVGLKKARRLIGDPALARAVTELARAVRSR